MAAVVAGSARAEEEEKVEQEEEEEEKEEDHVVASLLSGASLGLKELQAALNEVTVLATPHLLDKSTGGKSASSLTSTKGASVVQQQKTALPQQQQQQQQQHQQQQQKQPEAAPPSRVRGTKQVRSAPQPPQQTPPQSSATTSTDARARPQHQQQQQQQQIEEASCSSSLVPLKSALRSRKATGPRKACRISFKNEIRTSKIESLAPLGEALWYPGFVVQCDRCEQRVQWGQEGSIMGAPDRSRFAQDQVLCNGCLSDKLYSEIGAWVVVQLAAGRGGPSVAQAPITSLLTSLINLGSRGCNPKSDLLVALLGCEAEDLEVRTAVLRKACQQVPQLLGGSAPPPSIAAPGFVKHEVSEAEQPSAPSSSQASAPAAASGASRPTTTTTSSSSSSTSSSSSKGPRKSVPKVKAKAKAVRRSLPKAVKGKISSGSKRTPNKKGGQ